MHFVEDEVLEFRTEIGSVADARAGEIGLRFPGDIARIPARAAKARRSLLAQPRLLKSASSRFLPVHKADLERQQRALQRRHHPRCEGLILHKLNWA